MMGDEAASTVASIVKETAPVVTAGVKITASVLDIMFKMVTKTAGGISHGIWNVCFKDKWDTFLDDKHNEQLYKIKLKNGGYHNFMEFMGKYEKEHLASREISDIVLFRNENGNIEQENSNAMFHIIQKDLREHGIAYTFGYPEFTKDLKNSTFNLNHEFNGSNINILFRTEDEFKLTELEKKWQLDYIKLKHHEKYDPERQCEQQMVTPAQEKYELAIEEKIDKAAGQHIRNKESFKAENKILHEVWNKAELDGKSELILSDGVSNKEQFFKELQKLLGKEQDERLFVLDDYRAVLMDDKNNLITVDTWNMEMESVDMAQLRDLLKKEYSIPVEELTDEQIVSELKQYFKAANEKVQEREMNFETKYKDFSLGQKEFLRTSMIESLDNPDIKIEQFDDRKFTLGQMVWIKEAQIFQLDKSHIRDIIMDNLPAKQIYGMVSLKKLEHSVGKVDRELYEVFKDKNLSRTEIDVMIDSVRKNPNMTKQELIEVREKVRMEQQKFENLVTRGTIAIEEKEIKKDINLLIADAKMEERAQEIEHHELFQELQGKTKEEKEKDFNDLDKSYSDNAGHTWKHYGSENKFDYYINEAGESKAVLSIENVEKTEVIKDAMNKPPKYTDKDGTEWFSAAKDKKGTEILVTKEGKAKVEIEQKFVTNKEKEIAKKATRTLEKSQKAIKPNKGGDTR